MAECSYARCVQERRAIKKELQRWTKNMVFVVGLERVAEELMGKRKWKQYQETVLRTSLKIDIEPESQDWEAQDKCSFCDGGMFLGSAPSPKSDSGSSSRSSFHETPPATLLENSSATMTTLESVTSLAASLAAVAAYSANQNNSGNAPPSTLPFYPPPPHHHSGLFPPWYLSPPAPHLQPEPSDTPPAVMSLPATSSGSEQPLDLSAKAKEEIQNRVATPQSLKVPSIDSKHIFKAKPRMSAVAGRRTYTEEELQAALRDIQSGKLGTRRAAVIYGIPRSTLRNKVYKLAMEKERDSHLVVPAIEEKDLSGGEEEKEVERALRRPLLSMEDLVRFSMLDGDALRALLEEAAAGQNRESGSSSPLPAFPNAGDLWRGLEHSALGPYISQLLASTVQGDMTKSEGGESLPKFPSPLLPELVRRMMAEEQHQKNKKNQTGGHLETRVLVNGTSNEDTIKTDDKGLVSKLTVPPSLIEVQVATANSADGGTEVDETLDPDAAASTSNAATPPNVILKIPSFKPTTKNGVSPSGSGCSTSSDLPFQSVGGPAFPGQESSHTFSSSNNSGSESCSPPVANLTGKGIGVSLRDVIAKSISQKFQLQGELPLSQKLLLSADEQPLFKRGRFTPPPSVIKHNNNNSHVDDKNKQTSNNIKNNVISSNNSGKGTRPKRGKYRNYDRDSLVEAVRAVQRGEMSVHRAGSYYGVPHSTLEYKVKERHLMRPRKREPKQQLEDNRRKEDAGPTPLRSSGVPTINCDKLKLSPKPAKPAFTQPLPGAPNGLKIPPLFDPGLSPLAAYTNPAAPFSFWTPNPFHPLALPDLGGTAPGGFPPSPEQFFATQLMHRLPEESRGMPAARNPVAGVPMLGKSAREMAESLYDGTGANGSFLDGIIRSSLEMGLPPSGSPKEGSTGMGNSGKMSNKALIDQLCRNSCFPPLPKAPITSSSQDNSRMESNEQCADEEMVKVLSPSDKTVESDTVVSTVVDLSQSSNGLPDSDSRVVNDNGATKCCVEETVVSKDTATLSPMANTKGLPTPNEEPRLLSNEVNSLHDVNVCTPTDDESACDSKTIKKIGDIEVAKDLNEEGEETADPDIEEDTKSKMINS